MSKLAVLAGVLVSALPLACGGVTPQALDLPPGCVPVEDASYTLKVDAEAQVLPDCIGIHAGRTTLVWSGADDNNVRKTLIAFKANPRRPPADPNCASAKCTLSKRDHDALFGEFDYTVVVIQKNGKPMTKDPRLIIQP
jgi:hypothetical protein